MINRKLEKLIKQNLKTGQVVVLYGPRRVGKTTLVNNLINNLSGKVEFLNAEKSIDRVRIDTKEYKKLELLVANKDYLVIDEAQNINEIGKILKILVDNFSHIKILVTGSASFDLANKLGEPLTGRKKTFIMYPLSVGEMFGKNEEAILKEKTDELLVFGSYPKVYTTLNINEKQELLMELTDSYLYKDILQFEGIRHANKIRDLLVLLALQLGSEVSISELGASLGMHNDTVLKYLDLLEKSFVIFNLRGFSRNLRKEVTKTSKYYFYDCGVRNAIINNFNMPSLRSDIGALWENFCLIERKKHFEYDRIFANHYFWRTYDQKEIDLIEEREGSLFAYEFKYSGKNAKHPTEFLKTYKNSFFEVVDKTNIINFVL